MISTRKQLIIRTKLRTNKLKKLIKLGGGDGKSELRTIFCGSEVKLGATGRSKITVSPCFVQLQRIVKDK